MQDLILGNKYKNKKGLKASVKLWLVPFFSPGICSLFSELYIETNLPATFESLDTFNIWKNKKCPQISFKCLRGTQEGLKAILYQRIMGPIWLLLVQGDQDKEREKNYDPKDLF